MSRLAGAWLARVRRGLVGCFRHKVVFIGERREDLDGNPSSRFALLAVLGCEHYRHRSVSYPIRSRRELAQVLDYEIEPSALTFISSWDGESRQVDIYEIVGEDFLSSSRAVFFIPETLLLSRALTSDAIFKVERTGLCYFVAQTGLWHLAGGLVQNERAFILASGLSIDRVEIVDDRRALHEIILGLRKLQAAEWLDALSADLISKVWARVRPLAVMSLSVCAVYGLLVSVYLLVALSIRQSQIDSLGPEVGDLLAAQRRVDSLAVTSAGLSSVIAKTNRSWRVWEVPSTVWSGGGRVAAFTQFDGKIMIRGEAPNATDLLSRLSKLETFSAPAFASPVRQDGDQQQFVIELKPREASDVR